MAFQDGAHQFMGGSNMSSPGGLYHFRATPRPEVQGGGGSSSSGPAGAGAMGPPMDAMGVGLTGPQGFARSQDIATGWGGDLGGPVQQGGFSGGGSHLYLPAGGVSEQGYGGFSYGVGVGPGAGPAGGPGSGMMRMPALHSYAEQQAAVAAQLQQQQQQQQEHQMQIPQQEQGTHQLAPQGLQPAPQSTPQQQAARGSNAGSMPRGGPQKPKTPALEEERAFGDLGEIKFDAEDEDGGSSGGPGPGARDGSQGGTYVDGVSAEKYLTFQPAVPETVLYDKRGNKVEVKLGVSFSGNFFLSHTNALTTDSGGVDDSGSESRDQSLQPGSSNSGSGFSGDRKKDLLKYDLTFYRRNLFQVKATVSNAHNAVYAGNVENPVLRSRILSLSLAVSVTGNEPKHEPKLMYCPPKSRAAEDKKNVQEPGVKPIYPKNTGYDEVVNWKRLQFRTATAHNGRKKLQNYFSLKVSLYAELENAQRVCVMWASSRPIVVRGRNPRFYQNREYISIHEGTSRPLDEIPSGPGPNAAGTALASKPVDASGVLDTASPDESAGLKLEETAASSPPPISVAPPNSKKPRPEEVSPVSPSGKKDKEEDYEYFPMPINYWLPPVEVVYRPHAIHHPLKFSRTKPQSVGGESSKRYFSAVE